MKAILIMTSMSSPRSRVDTSCLILKEREELWLLVAMVVGVWLVLLGGGASLVGFLLFDSGLDVPLSVSP